MNSQSIEKNYFVDKILERISKNKDHIQEKWNNPTDTKTKHIVIDDLLSNED